jgi:exopolysaccharide biosynthesis polyprenyl glycosylphosphotransferase
MREQRQIFKYIFFDVLTALFSWTLFYSFRKVNWEGVQIEELYFIATRDDHYFLGFLFIPVFWCVLYFLMGQYKRIFRRHRVQEVGEVFVATLMGTLVLFFVVLLDDQLPNYKAYYTSLTFLFITHYLLVLTARFALTSFTVKRMNSGEWGFPALIVGGNAKALALYEEIRAAGQMSGYQFVGFVRINGKDDLLIQHMPFLGKVDDLPELIVRNKIKDVIIAVESSDHRDLERVLNLLLDFDVDISIIPDTFDLLSGSVKMTALYGVPLVRIRRDLMPTWQVSLKRLMDVVLSLMAMLLLLPVFVILAILVKGSSDGPVFFWQERIGKHGIPFKMMKFRTMYLDAEKNGPQLSSSFDQRITPIGKFLRKSRLDEIPQFWHVVIGEMSLVGPRPECAFYIDKIKETAPHVKKLLRVRPGITSWGQVKYGYAENVEQMVQRLKYDILYLENMTLAMDIKILFYTVVTVLRGRGK